MEGLTFYLVAWMVWIIATFLVDKKHPDRLKISLWILLVIILTPYDLTIYHINVSISALFILGTVYHVVARVTWSQSVYLFICSFIIMLAYTSFHIFELFDPVWVILPRNWMLSFLLVYFAVMLQRNKLNRIPIILLGSIHGEILYALVLNKYSITYLIGSQTFLDTMALSAATLTLWSAFGAMATYFEQYFNHELKEKRKLS